MDDDEEQKTYFGAIISIIVQIFFVLFVGKNFLQMINRDGTYLTRIEKNYSMDSDEAAEKFSLNQVNMMFFTVKNFRN